MTADRRDREYRHRSPCNYHGNSIRNAQQGYHGTLSGHHGESVGASDDTKKSGPEDRNVSLPAGPNMDGWDIRCYSTGRDWMAFRPEHVGRDCSLLPEILLQELPQEKRRACGTSSSIPCSVLMIPGELDEGIKEVVCDLEAAFPVGQEDQIEFVGIVSVDEAGLLHDLLELGQAVYLPLLLFCQLVECLRGILPAPLRGKQLFFEVVDFPTEFLHRVESLLHPVHSLSLLSPFSSASL